MRSPGKLVSKVAEHVGLASAVLGFLGFGSVFALCDDAREAFAERPGVCVLLVAVAFASGFLLAVLLFTRSRWARAAALGRAFMTMSKRRRAMVAKALDHGECRASAYDEDALALCDLDIFGVPPIQSRTGKTPFSIQPGVVREIREHRDEWLG